MTPVAPEPTPQPTPPSFLKLLQDLTDAVLKESLKGAPSVTELLGKFLQDADSSPSPSPYDDPRTPTPTPQSTEESSRLPTLRAGIYRHWKGGLYQVLGYAKDAEPPTHDPHRINVVYMSLKPTTAGHSMFTRPVQHFFEQVCTSSGRALGKCNQHLASSECKLVDRFSYLGPEYAV